MSLKRRQSWLVFLNYIIFTFLIFLPLPFLLSFSLVYNRVARQILLLIGIYGLLQCSKEILTTGCVFTISLWLSFFKSKWRALWNACLPVYTDLRVLSHLRSTAGKISVLISAVKSLILSFNKAVARSNKESAVLCTEVIETCNRFYPLLLNSTWRVVIPVPSPHPALSSDLLTVAEK